MKYLILSKATSAILESRNMLFNKLIMTDNLKHNIYSFKFKSVHM